MAQQTKSANRTEFRKLTKQNPSKMSSSPCKRETAQRTYRFNDQLWREFEVDCQLNLRNPRLVVEALVHYWLNAGPKTSEFIAWYQQKCAAGETISKHNLLPIPPTPNTA